MRKIFSLIAAVLFAGSMMAADVTITLENSGWSATAGAQSCTVSGVTVQCDNGVGNTQLRLYKNSTTTISVASTSVIKKIVFNCTAKGTSNYGPGNFTAQAGYSYADKVGTWVGEASSATFVASGAQVRAESIVVTVEDAPTVLKPAIVGDAQFFDEQEIAITCATEGAEIRYTLDGTDPTDASALYSKAIVITETTTIKAIAIKGADKSSIASASFKKAPSFATFEELVAATLDEHSLVEVAFEDIEIDSIYLNSQSKRFGIYFAINATVYEIYCNKDEIPAEWTVGGTVSGSIRGDWYSYKGVWELVPVAGDWKWENLTYAGSTTPPTPGTQIEVTMVSGEDGAELQWLDATASDGWWQLVGTNAEYYLSLSNSNTVTTPAGSYDASVMDPAWTWIKTETDSINLCAGGSITVAVDETGKVTIAGTLTGSDGNEYVLNLTYEDPTAKSEVSVEIADAELYEGYASYGLYAVYGKSDDNTYVQLAIWLEGFNGAFTSDDLDNQYVGCMLEDAAGEHAIFSAEGTATAYDNGAYEVNADVLCYNNTLYHVHMVIGDIPEGIEEILATGKAVKAVRNGQVVVLKGDKAFNMNGQIVK